MIITTTQRPLAEVLDANPCLSFQQFDFYKEELEIGPQKHVIIL